MISCRNIAKGKGKGELIVSSEPISFLGGVDPETGIIIDPTHELKGECIKDKVLFITGGKGSTVGSYVIFQMIAAIIIFTIAGITFLATYKPSVFDPRKYLTPARESVKKTVQHKIRDVFGSSNKA